jgi:hypothetical protein
MAGRARARQIRYQITSAQSEVHVAFGNVGKTVLMFALLLVPVTVHAQQAAPTRDGRTEAAQTTASKPALHDRLMPQSSVTSSVIVLTPNKDTAPHTTELVMARRGPATAFMVTGAALFVAGILISGDAGTAVMVAGAGIGAYGLYLNFR